MSLSRNFQRSEFACQCGCGYDTVDADLIKILQDVRDEYGPVKITSGCRCETHNRNEGGGENSQHLYGRAADIQVEGVDPEEVARYIEENHAPGGLGLYETFTHVDTRTNGPARW